MICQQNEYRRHGASYVLNPKVILHEQQGI